MAVRGEEYRADWGALVLAVRARSECARTMRAVERPAGPLYEDRGEIGKMRMQGAVLDACAQKELLPHAT